MATFYDIARKTRNALPYMQNYAGGIGSGMARNSAPAGMGQGFIQPDYYTPPGMANRTVFFENADPQMQYSNFADAVAATGGDIDQERKVAYMNAQEAEKRRQAQQKMALALMEEQRQREKNRQLAVSRQNALMADIARANRTEMNKEEDRKNAAIYRAGLLDPKNADRYLRQYKGNQEETDLFRLAMADAAKTNTQEELNKRRIEGGNLYSLISPSVQYGNREGFRNFNLKQGDLPEQYENALRLQADRYDNIADDNEKVAAAGLKRRGELKALIATAKAESKSSEADKLQKELERLDFDYTSKGLWGRSADNNFVNVWTEDKKPRWRGEIFEGSAEPDQSSFIDFSNQTSEAEVAAEIQRRNAAREAARREQLERDAAFRAQRSPEQVNAEQRREFAETQRQLDYARANPYSPATERFFRENPTRRSESAIQMPDWDGAGMSSPEVNQPNPLSQSPTVTPAPVVPTVPVQPLDDPGANAVTGGQEIADALNLALTLTPGQTSLRPEQEELIKATDIRNRASERFGLSRDEYRGMVIGEAAAIAGVSVAELNDPAVQATLNMRNLLERASARVSKNHYIKD
tara:strand:+ start:189 stop:1934 length:1746 start_codon:yes stop_codon:yes gene_type:complete